MKRETNLVSVRRRGQIKDTRPAITSLSHRPGVGRDGQLFVGWPVRRSPPARTGGKRPRGGKSDAAAAAAPRRRPDRDARSVVCVPLTPSEQCRVSNSKVFFPSINGTS